MSSGRVEPELSALRKSAEELAVRCREPVSSAHLLAAIAAGASPAADLLAERRVTTEEILRLGRVVRDEVSDPLRGALQRAHAIGARMGVTQASATHVLLALLNEPRSAARRVLEQQGSVDLGRLRAAAMQMGLGLVRSRRGAAGGASAVSARVVSAREMPATGRGVSEGSAKGRSEPSLRSEPSRAPRSSTAISIPVMPRLPPTKAPDAPVAVAPVAPGAVAPVGPAARVQAEPAPPAEMLAEDGDAPTPAPRVLAPAQPALAPAQVTAPAARGAMRAVAAVSATARFELDPKLFPTLNAVGKNLTLAAARGELDPVVVRDAAIEQTLDVLAKRESNNPCLVGIAGVGKTSVVRGLAARIASARDVHSLDDKIVVEIGFGELVAGTGVRGALAQRMGAIRREVLAARGRVVLFFDEIHQLFLGEAGDEIGSELKLALARGELPCIGATTFEEFQKTIGADAALSRRFSLVEIEEPSREEAYLVLEALRPKLEAHHRVRFHDEALALGVAWAVRYLPGRALPDKAVSIVDLAGARTRRRGKSAVQADAVAEVVAELCDMPVERLLEADGDRLLNLEEILAERVVGHGAPIRRIARILRRNAAGLGSRRPIGTFLLLGPSGVGKTETAKAIAEVLFHSDSAMTRIDLAEYGEPHAVARLIGAPPGYVGHEAGGQLTEAVRRRPYQVILLDELEKAHPDVLTAFLGVFDEGRLTDGRGRLVDFTNTVLLMTSNIGAGEATNARRKVGFGDSAEPSSDLEARIAAAARQKLAPELYNRIDEVLVYSPLSRDEVREIARRLLSGMNRTLEAQRGVRLEFGADLVEYLLERGGFEPALGARPMKRTIARLVEGPLAEKILGGELPRGAVVLAEIEDGELTFDVVEASAAE